MAQLVLLYRTVYAYVADWMGRDLVGEQTHGYVWLSLPAVPRYYHNTVNPLHSNKTLKV